MPGRPAAKAIPNNLPLQLTAFIGRSREKSEVKRLLGSTRLLTLTGASGAGKTRLALQVASEGMDPPCRAPARPPLTDCITL